MPEKEKYEKRKNDSNILTVDTVRTREISTGYGKLSPDRRSKRRLSARKPGSTTGYSCHCSLFDRNPKNMVAEKTRVRGTIRSVSMTRANDVARFTRTWNTAVEIDTRACETFRSLLSASPAEISECASF